MDFFLFFLNDLESAGATEATTRTAAEAAARSTIEVSATTIIVALTTLLLVALTVATLRVENLQHLLRREHLGELIGILLLYIQALLHRCNLLFLTVEVLL